MSDKKTDQLGGKIGRASLIVMGSVLLSRVLGQVRESYIAYTAGASGDVDAYNIAFQIPDILNHIVAGGYLSVTFIPLFTTYLERKDESQGFRLLSTVMTVFSLVMIGVTILAMLATPVLIEWVAPGYTGRPDIIAKAVRMTRIILPAQICFFLGGLLMAVQYAKGRFLIPSLAPLVYNMGIIAGGLIFAEHLGVEGFSWGVLAGAILGQLVLQVFGAIRIGMRFRPCFRIFHPEIKQFIWLTLPLILGLGMTFSTEFFFRLFGSYLGPGSIASLNYALRVDMLLIALFGQAAGVASFPYLARLYAQNSLSKLVQALDQTIRRYICLVIPASALMIVIAKEVVVVLFQRGAFGQEDTQQTSLALQVFLSGAFAMAMVNILVRGYYAMKNTWLPTVCTTLAVLASLPLYWLFMRMFQAPGVALGVALSGILQAFVLYTIWNRKTRNPALGTYLAMARAIVLSIPLAAVGWLVRQGLIRMMDPNGLLGAMIVIAGVSSVFVTLSLPLARLLKVKEIEQVWSPIADKLMLGLKSRKRKFFKT